MNPAQQPQLITVSIFEGGSSNQVSFSEKHKTEAPFFVAQSCLESHLEKICGSKIPGTKEMFIAYVMVNHDYPFRVYFEVCFESTRRTSAKSAATMAKADTGTGYDYKWIFQEDIDAFPMVDCTSGVPKVVLRDCAQAQRFSSYENINKTFENRIQCRLNRKLGFYVKPTLPGVADVGPDWETVDFVIRLAKGDSLEHVARAMGEANKQSRENSWKEVKETVALLSRGCSDEISILRTIYEMEANRASCADIVTKARAMIQDYDRKHTHQSRSARTAS